MSDAYASQPKPPAKEASLPVPRAPTGDTQTLGADDDRVRVGSAEREAAQERLREAVVHDLVTLDEYGERRLALPASWMITSDDVAGAIFGGTDTAVSLQGLDVDGETTIAAPVAFGSVEIRVPEGVRVERDGLVIFGSTECEACTTQPADADAPTVIVRSFGGFGGVDIVRESAR